jgi:hypothetical protein
MEKNYVLSTQAQMIFFNRTRIELKTFEGMWMEVLKIVQILRALIASLLLILRHICALSSAKQIK